MSKRFCLCVAIVSLIAVFILPISGEGASQTSSIKAFVSMVSGSEVRIFDDSRKNVALYKTGVKSIKSIIGKELFEGDNLLTDEDTIVEISIEPSGHTIRIGKNSWFRLTELKPTGQVSGVIEYGAARAKVATLKSTESFSLNAATTAAAVRGTDFALAVSARPTAEDSSGKDIGVFCFEGAVRVVKSIRKEGDNPEGLEAIPVVVQIEANQAVVLRSTASDVTQPQVQAIPPSVNSYWDEYDKVMVASGGPEPSPSPSASPQAAPLPQAAGVQIASESSSPEPSPVVSEALEQGTTASGSSTKESMLAGGLNLGGLGLLTAGAGLLIYSLGDVDIGQGMMIGGLIALGGGITLFSISFAIN